MPLPQYYSGANIDPWMSMMHGAHGRGTGTETTPAPRPPHPAAPRRAGRAKRNTLYYYAVRVFVLVMNIPSFK